MLFFKSKAFEKVTIKVIHIKSSGLSMPGLKIKLPYLVRLFL